MGNKKTLFGSTAAIAAVLAIVLLTGHAAAQHEAVLHSFGGYSKDGVFPQSGVIIDAAGNLYGTTYEGGAYGYGMVFDLSPKAGGGWTEKVLHNFNFNAGDGINPQTGLVIDASGNLYGTTRGGGTYGDGVVYELTPKATGAWGERILHSFNNNCQDGNDPEGGLVLDALGNLYGTTASGGGYCFYGTVFELVHKPGGAWTERILHSFNSDGSDGYDPSAGVSVDALGNLYGTTQNGGSYGYGTVFKLAPTRGGVWAEQILHSFNTDGTDGANPYAAVILDGSGNLFGTTYYGGATGVGAVFELSPGTGEIWSENILHSFTQNGTDGAFPRAGLASDSLGNLYGTTAGGGADNLYGTVFELMPASGREWIENVLIECNRQGYDPVASLLIGASGNLYGTTGQGGTNGGGTVFEITP